jgi:cysteine desulfurase/selenocysteine lyase
MSTWRKDFPIFTSHPDLVYLDTAATSQKPKVVVDKVTQVYTEMNANIHRGIYDLSQQTTEQFEAARQKVADFIGTKHPSEVIFTSNATEAINLAAYGWARKHLKAGDIILTSEMEHHSNLVPWLRLKEERGVEIVYLPVTKDYRLNYERDIDFKRVKLVALTHASNVLGTVNPIREIVAFFREKAPDIKVLVDAAQSVPHIPVNVQDLGADFLAFSSHKMLGPSGVGVLWAKQELLEDMDPLLVGSHMIDTVTKDKATWAQLPDKFEPGTRNIEGVIGLGAAIDYLQDVGMEKVAAYEHEVTEYALEQFKKHGIQLFGPSDAHDRLGVFSFAVGNVHAHDVAEILNRSHVAVRAGHHCAQPLMQCLGVTGTARASLYLYNTTADLDALMAAIKQVKKTFKV